ncbi:MAG TPA: PHP domain-containing protein [Chloroflexota bacterium]|nr:PHP domain-containing protein [Chloroflexota bacterium]
MVSTCVQYQRWPFFLGSLLRFLPRPRALPWRGTLAVSLPDEIPLRDGLHTDWHAHTRWSDGQVQVAEMAGQAERRGVTLGVSDHGLRDNVRLQTPEHIASYVADLKQYPVLRGIEISIGDMDVDEGRRSDDQVSIRRELALKGSEASSVLRQAGLLDDFDYVIASLHAIRVPEGAIHATRYLNWRAGLYPTYRPSLKRYDRRRYFQTALAALEDTAARWPVTILGHFCLMPELANKRGSYKLAEDPNPDQEALEWLEAIVQTCIRHDIAIELNSKSRAPHQAMIERALELGARFTLGSDAHQRHRAGDLSYGREMAQRLKIPADRFLTPQDVLSRRPDQTSGGAPAAAVKAQRADSPAA